MAVRVRRWCFTWNNPDVFPALPAIVRYLVYQREEGANGTEHFQGYVEFTVSCRLHRVKQWLDKAHWERAEGDAAANLKYCTKEEGRLAPPVIYGEPAGDGRPKQSLQDAIEILEEGGIRALTAECKAVYVKHHRGLHELWSRIMPERVEKPRVWWFYGPTGVGKTCFVEEAEGDSLWWSGETLQWFQGYEGQEAAIIDDFRADFCKFHTLLRYLDRYPVPVPVKGGHFKWVVKRIYITSNKHPGRMYNNRSDEDMRQLYRRIDKCVRFVAEGEVEEINLDSDEQLYD